MEVSSQLRAPAVLPQRKNVGTQWKGGCGLQSRLDDLEESKISCPCSGMSKPDRPARTSGSVTNFHWSLNLKWPKSDYCRVRAGETAFLRSVQLHAPAALLLGESALHSLPTKLGGNQIGCGRGKEDQRSNPSGKRTLAVKTAMSINSSDKWQSSANNRPRRPRGGIEVQLYSLSSVLDRGWWSTPRPGRFLPPGKTRYQLYRRLGGPQGWSGRVQKILPPPGFDPRTAQPVASRYTDWAIPVHSDNGRKGNTRFLSDLEGSSILEGGVFTGVAWRPAGDGRATHSEAATWLMSTSRHRRHLTLLRRYRTRSHHSQDTIGNSRMKYETRLPWKNTHRLQDQ